MMRQIVSAACGLWLCAATGAVAESREGVVVELYTSQGCASCPPADEFFATLADEPGVIPLALHVDYWDYIGWSDTFAQPGFTLRQKSYARAAGERMIYTPQVIVGGRARVVGAETAEVQAAIDAGQAAHSTVRLWLERQGDVLIIRAEAVPPLTEPVLVQLVRYQDQAAVDIGQGENAGLKVEYRNIVTSWDTLGQWDGQAPLSINAPAPGAEAAVVIVQREGPAEILAAAEWR